MKKINVENILCIFIIICPILDIVSFLFRNILGTRFSPSTIIRPIIPIMVTVYLFFKQDKRFKIFIILNGAVYGIYGIAHLYLLNEVLTGSSYGNVMHEAQYIINYTFMIVNMFLYVYIFKNSNMEKLKKSVFIAIIIYVVSIYISILSNTSSHTYIEEKMGYKGWFESGNSISAILILSMFIGIGYIKDKRVRKIAIPIFILMGIFLTMLIGTRVGLIGFILVLFIYAIVEILEGLIKNKKNNKKLIVGVIVGIAIMITTIICVGSTTIQRRKHLQEIESDIFDASKNEESHITGNLLEIKNKIEDNVLEEGYMNESQKESIMDLYQIANRLEIKNNDQRMQQFIYNFQLVKNQGNIFLILFGNGYMANFRELVMEMEVPAILFNFGVFGFLLYLGPLLAILIYSLYIGIKNWRKLDGEFILTFLGCGMAFVLSTLSGYIFFNSSAMMIIIVLHTILVNKCRKIKEVDSV